MFRTSAERRVGRGLQGARSTEGQRAECARPPKAVPGTRPSTREPRARGVSWGTSSAGPLDGGRAVSCEVQPALTVGASDTPWGAAPEGCTSHVHTDVCLSRKAVARPSRCAPDRTGLDVLTQGSGWRPCSRCGHLGTQQAVGSGAPLGTRSAAVRVSRGGVCGVVVMVP